MRRKYFQNVAYGNQVNPCIINCHRPGVNKILGYSCISDRHPKSTIAATTFACISNRAKKGTVLSTTELHLGDVLRPQIALKTRFTM